MGVKSLFPVGCVLVAALLAFPVPAQASLVIDYQGANSQHSPSRSAPVRTPVTSSGGDSANPGDPAYSIDTYSFDAATPLYTGVNNGGAGQDNSDVYGGLLIENTALGPWFVGDDTYDAIDYKFVVNTSGANAISGDYRTPGRFQSVLLWTQADFLNGGDSQQVSFDASSTLTMNVPYESYPTGGIRFVVRDGSTYYFGDTVFTSDGEHTVSPATETWNQWDPTADDTDFVLGDDEGTPAAPSFSNVTAVGFAAAFSNPEYNRAFYFDSFQVDAVVPEPVSSGLLALGGLVLLRRAKRSR